MDMYSVLLVVFFLLAIESVKSSEGGVSIRSPVAEHRHKFDLHVHGSVYGLQEHLSHVADSFISEIELVAAGEPERNLRVAVPRRLAAAEQYDSAHRQWLVHVKSPITEPLLDSINAALSPHKLGQYFPFNTYLLVCPESVALSAMDLPGVLVVLEFSKSFKIARRLSETVAADLVEDHHNIVLGQHSKQAQLSGDHFARSAEAEGSVAPHPFLNVMLAQSVDRQRRGSQVSAIQLLGNWTLQQPCMRGKVLDSIHLAVDVSRCGSPAEVWTSIVWISDQHAVHHIGQSDPARFELQNKYAHDIVQSDVVGDSAFWSRGLRGEGQIITYADTGLDYDHCMFSDDGAEVPLNSVSHDHRKIIMYETCKNEYGFDVGAGDLHGHGTHVAGTLAGKVFSTDNQTMSDLSYWNGMAPEAKLIVFDYYDDVQFSISENVYGEYYYASYEAGARISSNSWGDPYGDYDDFCIQTDQFVYDFPDYVMFFAAGNYGSNGYLSLTTPGVSKNCITVGSSLNAGDSFAELGMAHGINITAPDTLLTVFHVIPATYGPLFAELELQEDVQLVYVGQGCAALNETMASAVQGKIALVDYSGCHYSQKTSVVQAAGAILLIVWSRNTKSGAASIMNINSEFEDFTFTIPSVMISKHEGHSLFSHRSKLRTSYPVPFFDNSDTRKMSAFSSRGPTWDGRLKPDIIVPGDSVVSAHSDKDLTTNNCPDAASALKAMSGTSMAAPVAAGNAALIRQYFMDGYFPNPLIPGSGLGPSSTPDTNSSMVPSSALIKAVMITGGRAVGGKLINDDVAIPVTDPPSLMQGYGRVNMADVLLFHTELDQEVITPVAEKEQDFKLFVDDERIGISGLGVRTYCFSVVDSSMEDDFTATLAWNDPPAAATSDVLVVNNLDLSATNMVTGETYIGNNFGSRADVNEWDSINNVEKVVVNISTSSLFALKVFGTSVPVPKQPYALVVTGNFDVVDESLCHQLTCPGDCSGNGFCNQMGHCECFDRYFGADCAETAIYLIPGGESHLIAMTTEFLHSTTFKYYSPGGDTRIVFHATGVSGQGDADFYVTKPSNALPPSLVNYDYANLDCDACAEEDAVLEHEIVVEQSEVEAGVWEMSAAVFCCDAATYTVWVEAVNAFEYPDIETLLDSHDTPVEDEVSITEVTCQNILGAETDSYVGSTLVCNYTTATDHDDTELNVMFVWYDSTGIVADAGSQTYTIQSTVSGDIYCMVGDESRLWASQTSVTISKMPPVGSFPSVVATGAGVYECDYSYTAVDNDTEDVSLTQISWLVDGVVSAELTGRVLSSFNETGIATLACQVLVANEFSVALEAVTSAVVDLSVVSASFEGLPVLAAQPRVHQQTDNVYECLYEVTTASDDVDASYIMWILDYAVMGSTELSSEATIDLTHQDTAMNLLQCVVIPFSTAGFWGIRKASIEFDISLAVPYATEVNISTTVAESGYFVDATCRWTYHSDDEEAESGTLVRWFTAEASGAATEEYRTVYGATSNVLHVDLRENIVSNYLRCEVTVVNSHGIGDPVTTTSVQIREPEPVLILSSSTMPVADGANGTVVVWQVRLRVLIEYSATLVNGIDTAFAAIFREEVATNLGCSQANVAASNVTQYDTDSVLVSVFLIGSSAVSKATLLDSLLEYFNGDDSASTVSGRFFSLVDFEYTPEPVVTTLLVCENVVSTDSECPVTTDVDEDPQLKESTVWVVVLISFAAFVIISGCYVASQSNVFHCWKFQRLQEHPSSEDVELHLDVFDEDEEDSSMF